MGFASHGQSVYETEYNAGMGSNGLTSARHDIFDKTYREKYPESYDPEVDQDLIYSGSFQLEDRVEDMPVNMGKAVLSPTRTYAPVVKTLFHELGAEIHGMIHNTGGGQTKVIRFIDQLAVIKDQLMPIPPLFRYIQQESGAGDREMMEVFNMGHRLEVYLPENKAQEAVEIGRKYGIDAQVVGYCTPSDCQELRISTKSGENIWKM